MEIGELHTRLAKYLERYESDFYRDLFSQKDYTWNTKVLLELQTRMKRFDEYIALTKSLYGTAELRRDLLVNPKMKIESEADALAALEFGLPLLMAADYNSLDTLKAPILEAIAASGKKNGQILWPLRVALAGEEFSPGAFELAYILGREESERRIRAYFS